MGWRPIVAVCHYRSAQCGFCAWNAKADPFAACSWFAGKEAAAEALGALIWVSFGDPVERETMRGQVLPALLHLLGATTHDGCRCAVLAALRTMTGTPGTADFRWESVSWLSQ